MRWLRSLAAAIAVYAAFASVALAAELILIEYKRCGYCIRFNATVGRHYDQSPQAKVAPLRRIELSSKQELPADVRHIKIRGTPTFILRQAGEEVGRFDGFRNPDRFWAQLDALLAKIE